jgi:hypothetical protein
MVTKLGERGAEVEEARRREERAREEVEGIR